MQEQLQIEIEDEQQQPLYPSPEKQEDESRGNRIAIYVAYLGRFLCFCPYHIVSFEEEEEKEEEEADQVRHRRLLNKH